jgi:hypothetical protein
MSPPQRCNEEGAAPEQGSSRLPVEPGGQADTWHDLIRRRS